MPDIWGPDGPPEEAYSRVERDLVAITADFATHLRELPGRLSARWRCSVRPLTPDELDRLGEGHREPLAGGWAVVPDDATAATLLVARTTYEGGAAAVVGFGREVVVRLPSCFCDACDEDSESLIEEVARQVSAVVAGLQEFRRPPRPGSRLPADWREWGWSGPTGGSSTSSGLPVRRDDRPLFEVTWSPWTPRSG